MQINDTNSHLPYIQHTLTHSYTHTLTLTLRERKADTPMLAKLKWETRATQPSKQLKGGLPMVKFSSLPCPAPLDSYYVTVLSRYLCSR